MNKIEKLTQYRQEIASSTDTTWLLHLRDEFRADIANVEVGLKQFAGQPGIDDLRADLPFFKIIEADADARLKELTHS